MNTPGPDIREQVPLRDLTTFRTGGPARLLVECREREDIPRAFELAAERGLPVCVLGGGSNVVVADRGVDGVVLRMAARGIERLEEDAEAVVIRAAAGEEWDGLVAHCVARGWWGVENLSWIPGTVGAVPVQNVGAYGQEVADTILEVEAWDAEDRAWVVLPAGECGFGYRRSRFNADPAGRYVISRVTFRLPLHGRANIGHASVANRLETGGWSRRLDQALRRRIPALAPVLDRMRPPPTLARMRECIIALRRDGRLPDVATTGNAGSFFKNIVLDESAFGRLTDRAGREFGSEAARRLECIGRRFASAGGFKIPAGELVKLCGLQEARAGGAGLHPANPIVLVNASGSAAAADVLGLASRLIRAVWERTGVRLVPEPRFIGFTEAELAALDPQGSGAESATGPGGGHA